MSEENDCSICLMSLLGNVFKTECLHDFHRSCLQSWCRKGSVSGRPGCPMCRRNLDDSDLVHLLYEASTMRQIGHFNLRNIIENTFNRQITESRLTYESVLRSYFPRSTVRFSYREEQSVNSAFLLVSTDRRRNWMPNSWVISLRTRDGQTGEAFRLSQDGVNSVVRSYDGNPPDRLNICRVCKNAVFSDWNLLRRHITEKHARTWTMEEMIRISDF